MKKIVTYILEQTSLDMWEKFGILDNINEEDKPDLSLYLQKVKEIILLNPDMEDSNIYFNTIIFPCVVRAFNKNKTKLISIDPHDFVDNVYQTVINFNVEFELILKYIDKF
jgi:hypothetical protein